MEKSLGELINELRNEKDLTLKELADIAKVSYVEISHIEKGKHKPRPSTIRRLAIALDYSYSELYDISMKK